MFLALIVKRGEKDATLQGLTLPSLAFKVDRGCHSGYSGHSEVGAALSDSQQEQIKPHSPLQKGTAGTFNLSP